LTLKSLQPFVHATHPAATASGEHQTGNVCVSMDHQNDSLSRLRRDRYVMVLWPRAFRTIAQARRRIGEQSSIFWLECNQVG
jgi:hypothetical protein